MKILNFGSCNIDYIYSVSHFVTAGETISSKTMSEHPGGKGLNQSIAAARAGGQVYHAGNIGKDGAMLNELLKNNGVNVGYLNVCDEKTGHAIIQLEGSGENCIIVYPGANDLLNEKQIESAVKQFDKGDICMLQNETPCTDYIIKIAHERGMAVIWNPSPINDKIKLESLKHCDYVIINKTEGKYLSGETEPGKIINELSERYPGLRIVLTLGAEGCIYSDGETNLSQNAYKACAVDTTGAGDTFSGYFVAALSNGKTLKEALRLASAAAAISTEGLGAANSIPLLNETLNRMNSN